MIGRNVYRSQEKIYREREQVLREVWYLICFIKRSMYTSFMDISRVLEYQISKWISVYSLTRSLHYSIFGYGISFDYFGGEKKNKYFSVSRAFYFVYFVQTPLPYKKHHLLFLFLYPQYRTLRILDTDLIKPASKCNQLLAFPYFQCVGFKISIFFKSCNIKCIKCLLCFSTITTTPGHIRSLRYRSLVSENIATKHQMLQYTSFKTLLIASSYEKQ